MNEELKMLKKEFDRIKRLGYIKSSRQGTTGIGKTFEDLIGKQEDSLEGPDYHGIEIKTKRGYNTSYITLFSAIPQGSSEREIKRLRDLYGYPDKILQDEKVLRVDAYKNNNYLACQKYFFRLYVDYDEKKVILKIYNKNNVEIDSTSYWDFDYLYIKLFTKIKYLAYIKAWPIKKDNIEYYRYYSINFFELKGFDEFISLIDKGIIIITFNIGVYRTGIRKGNILDRGTSFKIKESDLNKLFKEIYVK